MVRRGLQGHSMITTFAGCAKRNFAAVERCIEPITEIRLVSHWVVPLGCLRRQVSTRRSTPCANFEADTQRSNRCAVEPNPLDDGEGLVGRHADGPSSGSMFAISRAAFARLSTCNEWAALSAAAAKFTRARTFANAVPVPATLPTSGPEIRSASSQPRTACSSKSPRSDGASIARGRHRHPWSDRAAASYRPAPTHGSGCRIAAPHVRLIWSCAFPVPQVWPWSSAHHSPATRT